MRRPDAETRCAAACGVHGERMSFVFGGWWSIRKSELRIANDDGNIRACNRIEPAGRNCQCEFTLREICDESEKVVEHVYRM